MLLFVLLTLHSFFFLSFYLHYIEFTFLPDTFLPKRLTIQYTNHVWANTRTGSWEDTTLAKLSLSYQEALNYYPNIKSFLSPSPSGHNFPAGQPHRAPADLSPHRRAGPSRQPEPWHRRAAGAGKAAQPGEAPRGACQLPAAAEPASAGASALGTGAGEAATAGRGRPAEVEGEGGGVSAAGGAFGRGEARTGEAKTDVPARPGEAEGVHTFGWERERTVGATEEVEEAQHGTEYGSTVRTGSWTGEMPPDSSCFHTYYPSPWDS